MKRESASILKSSRDKLVLSRGNLVAVDNEGSEILEPCDSIDTIAGFAGGKPGLLTILSVENARMCRQGFTSFQLTSNLAQRSPRSC